MLTSSPHLSRSAAVSPRTFHYGPTAPAANRSSHMASTICRSSNKSTSVSPFLAASISSGPTSSVPTTNSVCDPIMSALPRTSPGGGPAPSYAPIITNGTKPSVIDHGSKAAPTMPNATSASMTSPKLLRDTTGSSKLATPGTTSSILRGNSGSSLNRPRNSSGQRIPQQLLRTSSQESDLSPNKRRNSQNEGIPLSAELSQPAVNPASPRQSPAKRARLNAAPIIVVPHRYELCPVDDMVILISHMLSELIETNDSLALRGSGNLTRFHSRTSPGISVRDYLNRLAKHATLTPPLLLSMVYYIDRLCALYTDFTINTLTVHRFLITAATVAAKGLSDSFWNNSTYARVGGVRVNELKMLELEFLYRVDWRIVPNPDVLTAYYSGLVERCPGYVLQSSEDDEEDDLDGEESEISDNSVFSSALGSAAASGPGAVAEATAPSLSQTASVSDAQGP